MSKKPELNRRHQKAWFDRNRLKKQEAVRKRRHEHAELFVRLKSVPCADCGIAYPPYVMDFDHRPGEIKLFNLARARTYSKARVIAEVAKCDVVCANCHRHRTFERHEGNYLMSRRIYLD